MLRPALQTVEAFHLVFLRVLEARLNRAHFVVKGGVNLRAWFGSLRYSEDLDIDVLELDAHALGERIDELLVTPSFLTLLRSQAINLVRITKPKQTDTTQRWKLQILPASSSVALHTKVEFSRRATQDEFELKPVRSDIVAPYGIPAPTVNHYTALSAVRQKIRALAGRAQAQARDIWDLDHLFRMAPADARPLPLRLHSDLEEAADRVMELDFPIFQAQVVPFISPEHREIYGTPDSWDRMRELVVDRLLGFRS